MLFPSLVSSALFPAPFAPSMPPPLPRPRRNRGPLLGAFALALGVGASVYMSRRLGNTPHQHLAVVEFGGPALPPSLLHTADPGDAAAGVALLHHTDADYDAFTSCPRTKQRQERHLQWVFHEDVNAQVKSCTLTTTPTSIPAGVAWGPVSSYNWNGDFGYWFDAPGVRGGAGRLSSPCAWP